MLFKRLIIHQGERAVVIKNGRLARVLEPGSHNLFVWPYTALEIEIYKNAPVQIRARWAEDLAGGRPDLAAYFTVVKTDDSQIAMIYIDGGLSQVLLPGKQTIFWKGAATITVEKLLVIDTPELSTEALAAWEVV